MGSDRIASAAMDFWEQKSSHGGRLIWGFASSAGGSLSQSKQAEE